MQRCVYSIYLMDAGPLQSTPLNKAKNYSQSNTYKIFL